MYRSAPITPLWKSTKSRPPVQNILVLGDAHKPGSVGKDMEMAASSFAQMSYWLTASELWAAASATYRREALPARSTTAAKKAHEMADLCEGVQLRPVSGRRRSNLSAGDSARLRSWRPREPATQGSPTLSRFP